MVANGVLAILFDATIDSQESAGICRFPIVDQSWKLSEGAGRCRKVPDKRSIGWCVPELKAFQNLWRLVWLYWVDKEIADGRIVSFVPATWSSCM